ncbi:MAG: FAD:protein FMN transferase [Halioglobus sp.]|nr:FAD:protein FMN transferase [Halioglobus sp.]
MAVSKVRLQAFGRACQLVVDNTTGQGVELLELCRQDLQRLEAKFSAYNPASITSRLNQAAGTGAFIPLDAEEQSLFDYVDALWSQSKHLFDPTTRILRNCYDANGNLRASKDQLQGMLKLVGLAHLERSDAGLHLERKGMLLDLNACVRPYAVDSLYKLLTRNGAKHALIEMDHEVATIGKQPGGANWLIGVRLPKGSSAAISRLKLNNRGFAMRGDFEQAVVHDGERFGRALSPVDGRPVLGPLSVAVIADNCLTACSAASIARLKTESAAINWLEGLGMPWLVIDRQLHCHGPLAPGNQRL